jgi:hypothetical protein
MSDQAEPTNPLVDEVRRIRRRIVEQSGHDLDRLVAELRAIEHDFATRQAVFAGAREEAAAKVVASWGDVSAAPEDGVVGKRKRV